VDPTQVLVGAFLIHFGQVLFILGASANFTKYRAYLYRIWTSEAKAQFDKDRRTTEMKEIEKKDARIVNRSVLSDECSNPLMRAKLSIDVHVERKIPNASDQQLIMQDFD